VGPFFNEKWQQRPTRKDQGLRVENAEMTPHVQYGVESSEHCHAPHTFVTFVTHLSHICHTFVTHFSHICHTFVPHLSHICHTFVPHLSHICPTFVTHLSHICPTFVEIHFQHELAPLSPPPWRVCVTIYDDESHVCERGGLCSLCRWWSCSVRKEKCIKR